MQDRFPHLIAHESDGICWTQINRPRDRNSLDSELIDEVACHLEYLERRTTRAVVYTGGGDEYFIGGADGVEMMELSPAEARDFSKRIQGLFERMQASPLILVAAINGLCFGGGLEFALACDIRIASENARIGLPEVKVGLIPGGGGTQRLPRVVGMGRAIEMILTGHLYTPEEALAMGLIHRTAPHNALLNRCEELLSKILLRPQYALSAAKRAAYAAQKLPLDQGLDVEAEQFSTCFSHDYFPRLMEEQLRDGRLKTTRRNKNIQEG